MLLQPVYQQQFCLGFWLRSWLVGTRHSENRASVKRPIGILYICGIIQQRECTLKYIYINIGNEHYVYIYIGNVLWNAFCCPLNVLCGCLLPVACCCCCCCCWCRCRRCCPVSDKHQRRQSSSPNRWCSAPPELWKELQLGFEYRENANKMQKHMVQ